MNDFFEFYNNLSNLGSMSEELEQNITSSLEGIDAASRAEAGNLKYDYYIPFAASDDLLLIEKWADEDALKAHAETPHYARLKELKPAYVTDTLVERFADR